MHRCRCVIKHIHKCVNNIHRYEYCEWVGANYTTIEDRTLGFFPTGRHERAELRHERGAELILARDRFVKRPFHFHSVQLFSSNSVRLYSSSGVVDAVGADSASESASSSSSTTETSEDTDTSQSEDTFLVEKMQQMQQITPLMTPIHKYYALLPRSHSEIASQMHQAQQMRQQYTEKEVEASSSKEEIFNGNQKTVNLTSLRFDNRSLRELPISTPESPSPGAIFSIVAPAPLEAPEVVAVSSSALQLIDLSEDSANDPKFATYFSGNELFPGAQTAAHCYCGYQFGHFSGQLGDGAVLYIGEIVNQQQQRVEIQWKGSGLTPYSRMGDGRKVLRSSVREFLCAEANYFLGIPTCRSATLITSNSKVERDQFYEGNAKMENCAIITRLAPTFFRFGSFEICRTKDQLTGMSGPAVGRSDILQSLTEYTLKHFYPDIWSEWNSNSKESQIRCLLKLFATVCSRTAELVSKWQTFGFVHGVLNTDNMSILGLTIDYGPYAYMDYYQSNFISNSSDDNGRYAYGNQPSICAWNCGQFAYALLDLPIFDSMTDDELTEVSRLFSESLRKSYWQRYHEQYFETLCQKFGFLIPTDNNITNTDTETSNDILTRSSLSQLFREFFDTMENTCADFTLSFRLLSQLRPPSDDNTNFSGQINEILPYYNAICAPLGYFRQTLQSTMSERQLEFYTQMIEMGRFSDSSGRLAAEKSNKAKRATINGWSNQDKKNADAEKWKSWLHMYYVAVKADLLKIQSLSPSLSLDQIWKNRQKSMNLHNPKYILRNWIAQVAIAKAEVGDYSEFHNVLNRLNDPFAIDEAVSLDEVVHEDGADYPANAFEKVDATDPASATCGVPVRVPISIYQANAMQYAAPPPSWALKLRVSCSS